MVSYNWTTAASGDWAAASNWSPAGGPPTSTDDVAISAKGSAYTVTVSSDDSADALRLAYGKATLSVEGQSAALTLAGLLTIKAGSLIVANSGALAATRGVDLNGGALTIAAGGELTLTGKLSETGGTFALDGGAVYGGVIDATAGKLTIASGTLSGVKFEGPFNLTGASTSAHFTGGTKVVGASGSGPGTLNVTGSGAALYFEGNQTVSNATINLGGGAYDAYLYADDASNTGEQILRLAQSTTVDVFNSAQIQSGSASGDGIVNSGIVETGASSSHITLRGNSFTNAGTLSAAENASTIDIITMTFTNRGALGVSNGANLYIGATTFLTTAASVIDIGAGSSAEIGAAANQSWTNHGVISLGLGASLYLDGEISAASLGDIANSGGTVIIDQLGVYDNSGKKLNGSADFGQLTLFGGMVTGGLVTGAGLSFTDLGGVLSGVTFEGPLTLAAGYDDTVHLADGTKVVGASGSGPGVINVTGDNAYLCFDDTETVSDETINLGNSGAFAYLYAYNSTRAGGEVLTLGKSTTVDVVGYASIAAGGLGDVAVTNDGLIELNNGVAGNLAISGESFTNDGTISDSDTSGVIYIDCDFVNSGTLSVSNGGAFYVQPFTFSTTFATTSSSVISIGADSSFYISVAPFQAWTNLGVISLASGASLYAEGVISEASLGSVTNAGGTIYVQGTYDNAGETLEGAASFGQLALYGGTVDGGVVSEAGLAFTSLGGTLEDVTFAGPLDLTGANTKVTLNDGTTVVGSSGAGAGVIDISGASASLNLQNTLTLADDTINLGAPGVHTYLRAVDLGHAADQILTLTGSTTINSAGDAKIYAGSSAGVGDGIVNGGLIEQTSDSAGQLLIVGDDLANAGELSEADGSGALSIETQKFTNNGMLSATDGGDIIIDATDFTNYAEGTLTGGFYQVRLGSEIEIYNSEALQTLDADLTLNGAGSTLLVYDPTSKVTTAIDASLDAIASDGELFLQDGRDWTLGANDAFTNDGLLGLSGGTLSATASGASLTDAKGSRLAGYGTVFATSFTNSGVIDANGGVLTLEDAVTGTGALQINAGSGLVVDGAIGDGAIAKFAGDDAALTLASPSTFGATIEDFDLGGLSGDTIVTSWAFQSASINGTTSATVTLANGADTAMLNLVGDFASRKFTHTTSGGTTTVGFG